MLCCSRSPRLIIILLTIIAVTIGFGFYYQWPFITQYWPFLLILLCPLMHIFGGHDHQNRNSHSNADSPHEHLKKSGNGCH